MTQPPRNFILKHEILQLPAHTSREFVRDLLVEHAVLPRRDADHLRSRPRHVFRTRAARLGTLHELAKRRSATAYTGYVGAARAGG